MLVAALEVLVGIVAAVGMLQAASLAAHGYKKKQRELIAKRLSQGREDNRLPSQLRIQGDVEHDEAANKQNDEQYPTEPANK